MLCAVLRTGTVSGVDMHCFTVLRGLPSLQAFNHG